MKRRYQQNQHVFPRTVVSSQLIEFQTWVEQPWCFVGRDGTKHILTPDKGLTTGPKKGCSRSLTKWDDGLIRATYGDIGDYHKCSPSMGDSSERYIPGVPWWLVGSNHYCLHSLVRGFSVSFCCLSFSPVCIVYFPSVISTPPPRKCFYFQETVIHFQTLSRQKEAR